MNIGLRPGIYASYSTEAKKPVSMNTMAVGIAASESDDNALAKLAEIAKKNGAEKVYTAAVTNGDYASAAELLLGKGADIICCDSVSLEDQTAIKTALSDSETYSVCIFECGGTAESLTQRAVGFNDEGIMLIGNHGESNGLLSAAAAGLISCRLPSVSLNGAVLKGITELEYEYGDSEIEKLLSHGVTPLERLLDEVSIIRAVSTKTLTDGESDTTYRDMSTVLTRAYVMKSVSSAFEMSFGTASGYTASELRSLLASELGKLKASGVIKSFGDITAEALENDESVCRVCFEFTAVRGLNAIELKVHVDCEVENELRRTD